MAPSIPHCGEIMASLWQSEAEGAQEDEQDGREKVKGTDVAWLHRGLNEMTVAHGGYGLQRASKI